MPSSFFKINGTCEPALPSVYPMTGQGRLTLPEPRKSLSPSSLCLQERPSADLLLWKHGLCRFWDCCFLPCKLHDREQNIARVRGRMRSKFLCDEWKLIQLGGCWASTLELVPSWALDPVYLRLDTLFHVSWKSVLHLVPWAGWLIRGFSLWDVRHQNVSIRESLWDRAAGTL